MNGRDCKTSHDMYGLIEKIKEGYTLDLKDDTPDRIIGFMNECQREIDDYIHDRKDRVVDYFISCIKELLNESETCQIKKVRTR